jgi:hypothetical protein
MKTGAEKASCCLSMHKQSIIAEQQSFQTKFGKDPPVRKSTNQWHEKFQHDRCLYIVKCPG